MAKWCATVSGAIGYLLVVWHYSVGFAPVTGGIGRSLLWNMCCSCMSVSGLHSGRLLLALLVLGPINGAIYASIGYLIAKLLVRLSSDGRGASERQIAPR